MTTEYGNSDPSRGAERRGLSRRQMIKASAVAGAAAWTAPMIIDSLSSPAAAGSSCNKYYIKFQYDWKTVSTTRVIDKVYCVHFSPGCGDARDSGTFNLCCGDTAHTPPPVIPTVDFSTDANYIKVTLDSHCRWDKSFFSPSWVGHGNYDGTCGTDATAGNYASSPPASGDGGYVDGGQVLWVAKKKSYGSPTATSHEIDYTYQQFCCDTPQPCPSTCDSYVQKGC